MIKRLSFGEFSMEGVIPIIEVKNAEGEVAGYLSAFRGYSFQVSKTRDGIGDLASTHVFGLGHCIPQNTQDNWAFRSNLNRSEVERYIIMGQASIALSKFGEKLNCFLPKDVDPTTYDRNKEWVKFIDATLELIKSASTGA